MEDQACSVRFVIGAPDQTHRFDRSVLRRAANASAVAEDPRDFGLSVRNAHNHPALTVNWSIHGHRLCLDQRAHA
jgi:hypothetical protein